MLTWSRFIKMRALRTFSLGKFNCYISIANRPILSPGLTCGLFWVFGQFKKALTETMRTASGK